MWLFEVSFLFNDFEAYILALVKIFVSLNLLPFK